MNFIEYPDRDMMMVDVAGRLAGELADTLATGGRATLAVPGGTTPGPVFDVLCAASLDWGRVDVLPTDERVVPADHARSNERLIRAHLLTGRAAGARFHRIVPDGDEGLPDIADLLPVTVMLLGMGGDMHTASLFPDAPQLDAALAAGAPPLMRIDAPGQPEQRVSLTAPVIEAAMSRHLLITGADKRRAVERAFALDDPGEAPVAAALHGATVHWAE